MCFVSGFAFLAHWLGCLWYAIVESNSDVDWDSLDATSELTMRRLDASIASLDLHNDTLVACSGEDCVYRPWLETNLQHTDATLQTVNYRWIVSVYSALCMLLGENVGPVDVVEFWAHGLVLLLGAVIQAYIFGQVALLIADQNSTAVKWKQKMDNVRGMMTALELPKDLQQRIKNYYEYYWNRHRGINHSVVFSDLSEPLLSEISLCLHSDHVQKVPFFKDCQPHFLVAVVKVLLPRIYLPGDYIIVKGQYGKEMYFIRTGICKVLNNDGGVICDLDDGKSFGEVALYGALMRRTATVISSTYCDLDVLLKNDFNSLVAEFPDMQKKIAAKVVETAKNFKQGLSKDEKEMLHQGKDPNETEHLDTLQEEVPADDKEKRKASVAGQLANGIAGIKNLVHHSHRSPSANDRQVHTFSGQGSHRKHSNVITSVTKFARDLTNPPLNKSHSTKSIVEHAANPRGNVKDFLGSSKELPGPAINDTLKIQFRHKSPQSRKEHRVHPVEDIDEKPISVKDVLKTAHQPLEPSIPDWGVERQVVKGNSLDEVRSFELENTLDMGSYMESVDNKLEAIMSKLNGNDDAEACRNGHRKGQAQSQKCLLTPQMIEEALLRQGRPKTEVAQWKSLDGESQKGVLEKYQRHLDEIMGDMDFLGSVLCEHLLRQSPLQLGAS